MAKPTVLEYVLDRYEDALDRLATVRLRMSEEANERIAAQAERDTLARRLIESSDAGAAAEKAAAGWKQKALSLAAENANLKKLIPVENLPIEPAPATDVAAIFAARIDAPAHLPIGGDAPRDPTTDLPF